MLPLSLPGFHRIRPADTGQLAACARARGAGGRCRRCRRCTLRYAPRSSAVRAAATRPFWIRDRSILGCFWWGVGGRGGVFLSQQATYCRALVNVSCRRSGARARARPRHPAEISAPGGGGGARQLPGARDVARRSELRRFSSCAHVHNDVPRHDAGRAACMHCIEWRTAALTARTRRTPACAPPGAAWDAWTHIFLQQEGDPDAHHHHQPAVLRKSPSQQCARLRCVRCACGPVWPALSARRTAPIPLDDTVWQNACILRCQPKQMPHRTMNTGCPPVLGSQRAKARGHVRQQPQYTGRETAILRQS